MGRATGWGSRAQNRGFKGGIYPRPRKEVACGQRRYHRGGARAGAGAKKKPLVDKIAEGNPGRRKLTVIDFQDTADLEGQPMAETVSHAGPPPRRMARRWSPPRSMKRPGPGWRSGAAPLSVSPQLLERYAMSVAQAGYSVRRPSPSTGSSPSTPPRGTPFKAPMWR